MKTPEQRTIAAFVSATGYCGEEPLEPVSPMSETPPNAVHYWTWPTPSPVEGPT